MANPKAEQDDADDVLAHLRQHGYTQVAAKLRSDLLTIMTPAPDACPLARFRRVGASIWVLEMPTHTSRWEPTPYRAPLASLVEFLVGEFAWILEEARGTPSRTSGAMY